MLGLDEIEHLVHLIERVFDAARKDALVITGDVVELMFEAVDRVANLIDALKDPDIPAIEYEIVVERLIVAPVGRQRASKVTRGAVGIRRRDDVPGQLGSAFSRQFDLVRAGQHPRQFQGGLGRQRGPAQRISNDQDR